MATPPTADRSVRLAWAADAPAIGQVQVRAWQHSYRGLLPADILDATEADEFAQAWRHAIVSPPTARHRVLVALDAAEVVGFTATAPSPDPDAAPTDAELVALHVDPDRTGAGHGSRLLAAAVDTARADRFTRLRMWVATGDDQLRRFLEAAGWAPDTAHRTLELPDGQASLRQVRLHTAVGEPDQS